MKLAMVGLGKMGGNMVCRLAKAGHDVVAYDLSPEMGEGLAAKYESVQAATRKMSPIIKNSSLPLSVNFAPDNKSNVIKFSLRTIAPPEKLINKIIL